MQKQPLLLITYIHIVLYTDGHNQTLDLVLRMRTQSIRAYCRPVGRVRGRDEQGRTAAVGRDEPTFRMTNHQ